MAYPYEQIFAADPSDASRVATSGVVTIFAPGDTAQTPLTITTLTGLPLSNPIQVNDAGYGPAFMHATLDQVAWAGGGFTGLFVSYKGMKDEAVAARMAAEAAVTEVQSPTDVVVDRGILRADIPKLIANEVADAPAVIAAAAAATSTAITDANLLTKAASVGTLADIYSLKLRTNLASNPRLSTNAAHWEGLAGTDGGVDQFRIASTIATGSAYSAHLKWWKASSANGAGGVNYTDRMPVEAGKTIAASVRVKTNAPKRLRLELRWRKSDGTHISDVPSNTPEDALAGQVKTLTTSLVAPAGATTVEVLVTLRPSYGTTVTDGKWNVGDTLEATQMLVETVPTGSLPGSYFDGDDNLSYWVGTRGSSASKGGVSAASGITRANTAADATATGVADLDLGGGITARLPVGADLVTKPANVDALAAIQGLKLRTNLATNPRLTAASTYWEGMAGTSGGLDQFRITSTIFPGANSAQAKWWKASSENGAGGINYTERMPVTAGKSIAASVRVKTNAPKRLRLELRWRKSDGTFISDVPSATPEDVPAGQAKTLTASLTAPADAASVEVLITLRPSYGTTVTDGKWNVGDTLEATQMLVETVLSGNVPGSYFDGEDSLSYWTGTRGASTSKGGLTIAASGGGGTTVTESGLHWTDSRIGGVYEAPDTVNLKDQTVAWNKAMALLAARGGNLQLQDGAIGLAGATSPVPGGAKVSGTGFDYAQPTVTPPSYGTVIRATATMDRLIQLGADGGGYSTDPGVPGGSIYGLSVDGRNLAKTVVKTAARRNYLDTCQVYWGAERAVWLAGQNSYIVGKGVAAQNDRGDVVLVDSFYDHKIFDWELREPGATGACVRARGPLADLTISRTHMWSGANAVGKPAQGLIVIDASGTDPALSHVSNINITDNIIEGVMGPEILLLLGGVGAINALKINGNQFFNDDSNGTWPVFRVSGPGYVAAASITGNTAKGHSATDRYSSWFEFIDNPQMLRTVFMGNSGSHLTALEVGAHAGEIEYLGNPYYNGTATKYTDRRGKVTLNGTGAQTTFTIPHSLASAPKSVNVTPGSAAAAADCYVTSDATNISVIFNAAPAAGIGNVVLNWSASV